MGIKPGYHIRREESIQDFCPYHALLMVTKLGAMQFQIGGTTKWQRCKYTAGSLVWGPTPCCPVRTCLVPCSPTMIQPLYLLLELLLIWCLVSSL